MGRGGEGGLGKGPTSWCLCRSLARQSEGRTKAVARNWRRRDGAGRPPRRRKGRASAPRCSPPPTPSPAAPTSNPRQPTVSSALYSPRAHHRYGPSPNPFRQRAAAGSIWPRDETELGAGCALGAWGGALRTSWAGR